MNKLITTTQGGMPLTQDDFGFIQDSIFEGLYDQFKAFGVEPKESFKLWGAQVTLAGNTFTCGTGAIVLNGEILHVTNHSITVSPGKSARFVLKTAFDPAGLKDFKPPAGQNNVYQLRYAELEEYTVTVPSTSMGYGAPYIHEVIKSKLLAIEEIWQPVGSVGVPFLNNCANIGGSLATAGYRMGNNGIVMLKGTISVPGGSYCDLFRLPTRYRPTGSRCFLVSSDTDNFIPAYVVIQQDGFVALRSDVTQVSIDGIMFYL